MSCRSRALSEGSSTKSTTTLDERIESIVEEKLSAFAANQNKLLNRLQLTEYRLEEIRRACCTKPKPIAINSLSCIDSCSAPRKSGKIRQNPSTPAQVDVPKS
jgi:hypothetical protein